ncbi:NB-ARC domain protein [Actinobacteria bacterium OK074]|nr:NB-ARC domain protein [Actinobacteria bacterium OK074]
MRVPGESADRLVANEPITISFAGFNRPWAAWIGDRLERRGCRVVYQRWDAPPEVPLADLLRDLKLAPGRILIIVSEWYFQLGPRTHEEWNAALREVVAPDPERFAAVSVTTASVPTATAVLAAEDLTYKGAEEAERRLLDRLDLLDKPIVVPDDGTRRGSRFPNTLPEIWGGVPRRNPRFTGREPLLHEAYQLFTNAEPGAGVVAFHGMPGVGKTQLAAEYVHRFGSEYDVVWWIDAESRAKYRRFLAELAPKLGLPTGAEYGERLRAVRNALRRGEPYTRWLLILDGADEPEQIADLLPNGPGHLLITARNALWSEHNSQLLEVPIYMREESVAFIRRRALRLGTAEADRLAEALEDLPLLLDQTAGWLNDSDMSVPEYIRLLESGIDENLVKPSADFPISFQKAWSVLLRRLRDILPESVDLLRLCTFFAPGAVPVGLLRGVSVEGLPPRVARLLGDPVLWSRAINQLRVYSVIRLESHQSAADEQGSSAESVYLHRMVHQIVRQSMSDEDRGEFADCVRQALVAADPGRSDDPRLWDKYAEILPHLDNAGVLESQDPAAQRLLLNCLRYSYRSGEYATGIKLAERAMETWKALLGEHQTQIWELTHHYVNLLREVGRYSLCEAIDRKAVEYLRERRGERDLTYVRAVGSLAADLRHLARYDEALELDEWVFSTCEHLLQGSNPQTLRASNNLAVSLRLLGRYGEALEIDRRTLEVRREVLRERNSETLLSSLSSAIDLRQLGRYTEAESVQRDNVEETRRALGPDDWLTLMAEHNLAMCWYREGRREKAGPILADVLERSERVLGDASKCTLIFAAGMSCFLREHGNVDHARDISETVVSRYQAMLAAGHPFIAGVRSNHALVLSNVGELEQAHTLAEESLATMTAAVGESHPWTLGCAINTSAVRILVGDLESAATLDEDTATRARDVLGPTHPLTLSARIALADDLRRLRERRRADSIEQEALSDLAATLGPHHVHTVSARSRKRPFWDFEPLLG